MHQLSLTIANQNSLMQTDLQQEPPYPHESSPGKNAPYLTSK